MRIAAIICEYNPFHPGHRYQIAELRRQWGADTGVICLMSGNYVQRGEPAAMDKWSRAEAAVLGGADLVLELPMTAAVNAAGYFAAGAVDALAALGCVEGLCFGTEGLGAEPLADAARRMAEPGYETALRAALASGRPYAAARTQALERVGGDPRCLLTPNCALGVDYLRRLQALGSPMIPLPIPRKTGLPSATALRGAMTEAHTLAHGQRAMLAVLRRLPDQAFRDAPFGGEGLWSKVMRACRREDSLEEILFACKSKRYAMSRLKRMLLCLFLGLGEAELRQKSPYLRVLAFNGRGQALLHAMKQTSALPLISGALPRTPEARAYFALESRATDLYALFAPPEVTEPAGREHTEKPRRVAPEAGGAKI